MADSPLAEINWDNLEGQHLITAVNLLQLAFAERMNMAQLVGPFRFLGNNARILRMFPFLDNAPDVGRKNWPAMWGRHTPALGINVALSSYLSETKLANVLGTDPVVGFRQNNVALDEATLLSDLGVIEYPRMDIITTENVRFWYDLITSLKYILVDFAHGGAGSAGNNKFIASYSEGIFEGNNSDLRYGPALPNPNPLANLGPDWDALWDNSVRTKQLVINSFPAMRIRYSTFGISNQFADVAAVKTYSRFDTSDYDNTAIGGAPIDIRTYGSNLIGGSSPSATQWATDNGYTNNEIIQLPPAERDVLAGNIVERSIPFDVPSNPSDLSFDTKRMTINHATYEGWDAEGGFEFYTPT